MANILDYLLWRGDLPLEMVPFCSVDNLVLCELSYVGYLGAADWEQGGELTLKDAAHWFQAQPEDHQHYRSPFDRELLHLAGESRRFGSVKLTRYRETFRPEEELQFCAMTFLLDEETAFVAYRGTDSTLVGWKEDFNMSFKPLVPAQVEAKAYLDSLRDLPRRKLLIGGHSKGGNLAVYASSQCQSSVQDKIVTVYCNDGPGFVRPFLESPEYRRIRERILCLVPQSSIIGKMLEQNAACRVIHSVESGLSQHDPYTWELFGPDFISEESVDATSQVIDQTLKLWLDSMSPEEREEFVNQVYLGFQSTKVETLREFSQEKAKNSAALFRAWREAAPETRQFLATSTKKLLASFRSSLSSQRRSPEKKEPLEERLHWLEDLETRMEQENTKDD